MAIELSPVWIVVWNVVGWAGVQLGLAWGFTRLPWRRFDPRHAFFRTRAWERGGVFYERVAGIRAWKDLLPDGATWFRGGFAKGALSGADVGYLDRFARETCRGELVHWLALLAAPVFFLWNPWWGDLINVAYALAANAPCILVQRYNRARLTRVSRRRLARQTR